MKKKILKIAALVMAVALIIGVCIFANSLVGNPVSAALAKNTAKKHIEENYADRGYELESVSYSFKDGYYHAHASVPDGVDSEFTILINGLGQLKVDLYDNNVTNGWNTARRLDGEYRDTVKLIFDSGVIPHGVHIGYGDLEFITAEHKDSSGVKDYAILTSELTLGAYYNVGQLGARAGKLTVYVADNDVSTERMAQILLDIRECFDGAGVGFYAIDCVLEYPQDDNGFIADGRVEVREFLYADIREEGLAERVEAANAQSEADDYVWGEEKDA